MHENPVLTTRDPQRGRLVMRIREALKARAITLTPSTIEQLLDIYDSQREAE